MKTYDICVIETIDDYFSVQAESPEDAVEQIKRDYDAQELEFDIPRDPDVKFLIQEQGVLDWFTIGVVEICDKGQNNWKVHNIFKQVNTVESLLESLKEVCKVLCKMPENAGKCFRYRLGDVILDSSHTCVPYYFENYPTD